MTSEETLEERLKREPRWMERPLFAHLFRHSSAIILCVFLFSFYGLFLSHPIDLTTADLGRHIKNGEILFQDASVLQRNFYSYTEPDFPVINHHWGSGLLFYWTFVLFGFTGVQLFFILLSFATFFVFLKTARLCSSWGIAGLTAIPAIFLLAERTEIRPEVFSYLFAGVFFYVLSRYRESLDLANTDGRRYLLNPAKTLFLLPLVQILWVNTHIYFLLGPLILGAFLLESLLVNRSRCIRLFFAFCSVLLASLINPYGYKAVTETVGIFKNYGYRLAENQPVWFMEKLMPDPNFLIFKIVFGVCVLLTIGVAVRRWRSLRLSHLFVFAGMSVLGWLAIRNLALFGLFAIPCIAGNIQLLLRERGAREWLTQWAIYTTAFVFLFSLLFGLQRFFPYWHSFGYGLREGNSAPADFLRTNRISGPYFNNYDIGGYLIFYLFPSEKVFVDNRPEAYTADFFKKVYIPMQEDNEVWKEKLGEYRFNTIIFSHRDATPWGQRFLIQRLQDPEWAPVYVDQRVLILVRRKPANQRIIDASLLPPETFRISS